MLADVALWGYLRIDSAGLATEAALGPVSFDAIRQSTDNTLALIHVSGSVSYTHLTLPTSDLV